jgi:hypothetical protein
MAIKDAIVGGVLAGLVGGSMVAGAIVATRASGAIQVYGSVDVNSLPAQLAGGNGPVLVKVVEPTSYSGALGSATNPIYLADQGPTYVFSCENHSSSYATSQHCK